MWRNYLEIIQYVLSKESQRRLMGNSILGQWHTLHQSICMEEKKAVRITSRESLS